MNTGVSSGSSALATVTAVIHPAQRNRERAHRHQVGSSVGQRRSVVECSRPSDRSGDDNASRGSGSSRQKSMCRRPAQTRRNPEVQRREGAQSLRVLGSTPGPLTGSKIVVVTSSLPLICRSPPVNSTRCARLKGYAARSRRSRDRSGGRGSRPRATAAVPSPCLRERLVEAAEHVRRRVDAAPQFQRCVRFRYMRAAGFVETARRLHAAGDDVVAEDVAEQRRDPAADVGAEAVDADADHRLAEEVDDSCGL